MIFALLGGLALLLPNVSKAAPAAAITYDCTTQVTMDVTQCDALVAIYNNTGGDTWVTNTGWGVALSDPCTWYGVLCAGLDVDQLALDTNNLSGSLPTEIGDLVNMRFLFLNNNAGLSGSLPTSVGNLIALQNLDLTNNSGITGAMPSTMTGMTAMGAGGFLSYSGTGLCEPTDATFQTWIAGVTTDTTVTCGPAPGLCASQSSITESECDALEVFYNSTNGGSWTDNTGWSTDPDPCNWYGVVCAGGHVDQLDLDNNNLTGSLPADFEDLDYLRYLDLADNGITGNIPSEIGSMSSLQYLYLENNDLGNNLPPELGNLDEIIVLSVGDNNISGEVPEALGDLTTLEALNLEDNSFSGSIPAALGELINLEALGLSGNNFSGGLTSTLSDLTNLIYLSLDHNDLIGPLPTGFHYLENLDYFYYNDTELCAPTNPTYQNWEKTIANLDTSGLECDPPTATPSSGSGSYAPVPTLDLETATATLDPASPTRVNITPTLNAPEQTLTQMAFEATMTTTFMPGFVLPTNTPTSEFVAPTSVGDDPFGFDTPTPTTEGDGGDQGAVVPGDGGDDAGTGEPEEEEGGFSIMKLILYGGLGIGVLVLLVGGGMELYKYLQGRGGRPGGGDDVEEVFDY